VLVDDEKIVKTQFDKICGDNHELFSHTIVLKQWVSMDAPTKETKNSNPINEKTR